MRRTDTSSRWAQSEGILGSLTHKQTKLRGYDNTCDRSVYVGLCSDRSVCASSDRNVYASSDRSVYASSDRSVYASSDRSVYISSDRSVYASSDRNV